MHINGISPYIKNTGYKKQNAKSNVSNFSSIPAQDTVSFGMAKIPNHAFKPDFSTFNYATPRQANKILKHKSQSDLAALYLYNKETENHENFLQYLLRCYPTDLVQTAIKNAPKNKEVLKAMLTSENIFGQDTLKYAAIHNGGQTKAILDMAPDEETLKHMLTSKTEYGENALMCAASAKERMDYGVAGNAILDAVPDEETLIRIITDTDKHGNNALNLATKNFNSETSEAILDAVPDMETLIKILTNKNKDGNNAIHLAATEGESYSLEAILNAAAKCLKTEEIFFNSKDKQKPNLLFEAKDSNRSVEVILDAAPDEDTLNRLLLEKNEEGFTALDEAISMPDALFKKIKTIIKVMLKKAPKETAIKLLTDPKPDNLTPLVNAANKTSDYVNAIIQTAPEEVRRELDYGRALCKAHNGYRMNEVIDIIANILKDDEEMQRKSAPAVARGLEVEEALKYISAEILKDALLDDSEEIPDIDSKEFAYIKSLVKHLAVKTEEINVRDSIALLEKYAPEEINLIGYLKCL